jgi:hypothetical protein
MAGALDDRMKRARIKAVIDGGPPPPIYESPIKVPRINLGNPIGEAEWIRRLFRYRDSGEWDEQAYGPRPFERWCAAPTRLIAAVGLKPG